MFRVLLVGVLGLFLGPGALASESNLKHLPMVRSRAPSAKSADALLTAKFQHWNELLAEKGKAAAGTKNLPLIGNVYPLGIYGIDMAIGTPLQSVQVAVDSGSCTLVVVGEGCKGCNMSVPRFDPKKSSTCDPAYCPKGSSRCAPAECQVSNRCHFSNSYQVGRFSPLFVFFTSPLTPFLSCNHFLDVQLAAP
jgi:Xylanase inhibitor N-terminal